MSTEYSHEFNTLLGGEISAVETYDLAIQKCVSSQVRESLQACRDSHMNRVNSLTSCVAETGGTPATGAGPWGAFANMVQKTASCERDALALLEEQEAERLVQYEAQREIAPPVVASVLANELLPAQHQTHLVIAALLKDATPAVS